MSDTFFHLSSCKTCQRIAEEIKVNKSSVTLRDIKSEPLTPEELDHLKKLAGDYESLFTRRSMKYREWNLKELTLGEADYRKYILEHYTFLKRPVLVVGEKIFCGSSKKIVGAMSDELWPKVS